MCVYKYEHNWKDLKGKLRQEDVIQLLSLSDLCRDEIGPIEKLQFFSSQGVQLKLRDIFLDEGFSNDIIEMITLEEERKKRELKKAQRRGIDKALRRKKSGTGSYGRPHAILPKDFEEQVRRCIQQNQTLEDYRKTTGIKKATFYKYAKMVKQ